MSSSTVSELNIVCFFSQKLVGVAFTDLLRRLCAPAKIELYSSLDDFIEISMTKSTRLVIIDEIIRGGDISEVIKVVKKKFDPVKIIVFGDNSKLAAFALMTCGASGYLEKSSEEFELSRAIEVVVNGGNYLPQKLIVQLMEAERNTKGLRRRLESLTPSEKLLIYELSKGGNMRQISQRVNKAITTLSTQKRRVMQKLRVGTNHELMSLIREYSAQDLPNA